MRLRYGKRRKRREIGASGKRKALTGKSKRRRKGGEINRSTRIRREERGWRENTGGGERRSSTMSKPAPTPRIPSVSVQMRGTWRKGVRKRKMKGEREKATERD